MHASPPENFQSVPPVFLICPCSHAPWETWKLKNKFPGAESSSKKKMKMSYKILEMVKTTPLIRFCPIYSNSLPKRAISFKISEFGALCSEIFRFLYAGFYCITTCRCLLFDLFCFHIKCSGFEGAQIHLSR